jgi:hypothetical protein
VPNCIAFYQTALTSIGVVEVKAMTLTMTAAGSNAALLHGSCCCCFYDRVVLTSYDEKTSAGLVTVALTTSHPYNHR